MSVAICFLMVGLMLVALAAACIYHAEPEPTTDNPLVEPQSCRRCGVRCQATYCPDCQFAETDTASAKPRLLGSGYLPSAWCPGCHAPHAAQLTRCPECDLAHGGVKP